MPYLLVFLALITSLCANTIVSENDPSTLVEGVSVITGDLYTFEEDLVVPGAEPIRFRRASISSVGNLKQFPHLVSAFLVAVNKFRVVEPNGTSIFYKWSDLHREEDDPIRFDAAPFYASAPGVSNTSSGQISGQTNLKNQYLLIDTKMKRFVVHTANGTKRHYSGFRNQEKVDIPFGGKGFLIRYYRLKSEELPNGNRIQYNWNDKDELEGISTLSPTSKKYASASFPEWNPERPLSDLTIHGSFGKKLSCRYAMVDNKMMAIESIASSDYPTQSFSHDVRDKRAILRSVSLPNKRTLAIDYDEGRVKTLSSRVGSDDKLIITHSFFYDLEKKNSHVLDAQGNKTAYFWNEQYRLSAIQKFLGENEFHSEERFEWDGMNLRSKTFYDTDRKILFSREFVYDGQGNIVEEIFQGVNGEKSCKKTAYKNNLPIRQEEPNGLVTSYEYVPGTHLLKSKVINEIRHFYEYDEDLILIREIVDDGIARTVKQITPFKEWLFVGMPESINEFPIKTVFHYGKDALIKKRDIYDADGMFRYSLNYEHDEKGRIVRETNPLGQEAASRYDEIGNKTYFKDFSGHIETHCKYDFSNRLIEKEEIGFDGIRKIFKYDYDTKHNLISEIDERGNETRYVVNPFGQRIETRLPDGAVLRQAYDSAGNEILRADGEEFATLTSYNAYGKPVLVIHPDGAKDKYTYSADGELKTYTDPKGVVTSYEHDLLRRVVRKTTAGAQESFEYIGMHLVSKIDAEGNRTVYTYDQYGRKIAEEIAGEKTTYSYDSLGRVREVQKGALSTLMEYDLLGRVIEERNNARIVKYEYDSAGNRTAVIQNVAGKESKEISKYDSFNRLIQKTNALGFSETIEYKDGKILYKTHTDPMGLKTVETFDAMNRVEKVEKRQGKILGLEEKTYNKNGLLTLQVNTIFSPDGSFRKVNTRWEYDEKGRLKALVEADEKVTSKSYTARGELETTIKPDGTTLYYTYNDLGLLTSLRSSEGSVHHEMRYDQLGRLIWFDGIERSVDPRGRVLSENFPQGFSVENRYDPTGRRIECQIPSGSIEYEYQAKDLKRVTRKTDQGEALYSHEYLSHDLAGNLLEEQLINGEQIHYNIDPLSRKTSISAPNFSQEVLQFDPAGNILHLRTQQERAAYTYDELYQLTSETGVFTHNYLYDTLYNRLQKDDKTYQVNALQQITSHLGYNRNGNVIRNGDTQYHYDALDRLIRLETPTLVQTFTYDFLNRCLSKTTAQGTRYFLHDGKNEIGAFDEQLNLIELRILGHAPHAEIGAAIAIELEGKLFAPIHDLCGNIAALVSNLSASYYKYSAFGEEKILGEVLSPWRFSSKRSDETTGLVYYGRRFYSPEFGRWLTPDPAGFSDGMNLYAFVHNDPLTHFDEYGLICLPLSAGSIERTINVSRPGYLQGERWGVNRWCRDSAEGLFRGVTMFGQNINYDLISPSQANCYADRVVKDMRHWISSRMSTPAQWDNPHFQAGYANGQWSARLGSEALLFWATSGGSGGLRASGAVAEAAPSFLRAMEKSASLATPKLGNLSQKLKLASPRGIGQEITHVRFARTIDLMRDVLFPNSLKNTIYRRKVLYQMRLHEKTALPEHHAFPRIVDNYARYGRQEKIIGNDGIQRLKISVDGGYQNREGYFEWIIESDGTINHRIFTGIK